MVGKDKNISIGLEYRLDALEKSFSKIEGTMRKQHRKLERVGKQLSVAISLPIITGLGLAAKEFAEFEQSMAKVQAVSGAAAGEFSDLKTNAEELGRTTRYTAKDVAGLEFSYAKLGFSSAEILKITEATLDLALATSEDLAGSAEVAGSTLRGFNLEASEMPRVVDVMAKAFTSSALDLEKFKVSISKVAPIAAVTGRSLEEVAAMQSVLADTGVEASIIGTSLRKIFGDLAKSGMTYDQAMNAIRTSTNKVATATELFDIRAAAAAVTLSMQQGKLDDLLGTYNKATGASKEMGKIMNDTLEMSITRLRSAVEGLAIKFGEILAPALRRVSEILATVARGLATFSKETKSTIVTFLAITAALGPVIVAMTAFTAIVGTLGAPLLASVATLGAIVFGFTQIYAIANRATGSVEDFLETYEVGNKALEDNQAVLKEDIRNLEELIVKLKFTKTATKERADALNDLGTYYGVYLKDLEDEQEFLGQIDSAYDDIVGSMRKKAEMSLHQGKMNELVATELRLVKLLKEEWDSMWNVETPSERNVWEKNIAKTTLALETVRKELKQLDQEVKKTFGGGTYTPKDDDKDKMKPKVILPWSFADYDELFPEIDSWFSKSWDEIIGKAKEGIWIDNGGIASDLEKWFLEQKEKVENFTADINELIEKSVEDAVYNIADMFGTMLTDDEFTGKDFGKGMLEMVADFLQKFGGLMIAWGLNFKLFKESVKSGQAVPAIIAGAAMVAAGAAIKGALKGGIGASVSVQPTYSGSNGGTNYAANDYSSEVMIRGREMIIVQSRERSFRR